MKIIRYLIDEIFRRKRDDLSEKIRFQSSRTTDGMSSGNRLVEKLFQVRFDFLFFFFQRTFPFTIHGHECLRTS